MFINELFPVDVSYGAKRIIKTSVTKAYNQAGYRQATINWSTPLDEWDVSFGVRKPEDVAAVAAFYQNTLGAHTFRFKDWFDYQVTSGGVFVQLTATTFQMYRTVTFGGQSLTRKVTKPVLGSILVTGGVDVSVDYSTGVVTVSSGTPTSWTGEIHKHVEFDLDSIPLEIVDFEIFSTSGIKVKEVRE